MNTFNELIEKYGKNIKNTTNTISNKIKYSDMSTNFQDVIKSKQLFFVLLLFIIVIIVLFYNYVIVYYRKLRLKYKYMSNIKSPEFICSQYDVCNLDQQTGFMNGTDEYKFDTSKYTKISENQKGMTYSFMIKLDIDKYREYNKNIDSNNILSFNNDDDNNLMNIRYVKQDSTNYNIEINIVKNKITIGGIKFNKWLFFTITYDINNQTADIYIDGKLENIVLFDTYDITDTKLRICKLETDNGFPGYIMFIRYFRKYMNNTDVQEIFEYYKNKTYTNYGSDIYWNENSFSSTNIKNQLNKNI